MHPILIATVALVGLPILLHFLMKQEPKRLPFPALRLLKIKKKTNQQKLRIRHWLLLALRMLIIALFGLALYQPTLLSEGQFLRTEQPIAAVFIIDKSPSMGYRVGAISRLDEARRRAFELIDDLPAGSRIAVIDPTDPTAGWELTAGDARTKIETFKEPSGTAVPISNGLIAAYQLLKTVDQEAEQSEPLPRLVAVFTDRETGCWETIRTDDLIKIRDSVPQPKVAHAVFDVGIDQPANVGILNAEMKPQVISSGQVARVMVTVGANGPDVTTAVLRAKLDDSATIERKPVPRLVNGSSAAVTFEFSNLSKGVHQLEFSLETEDNLLADNVRYFTFQVAKPRKILTISDDPDDASLWATAHEAKGEFECTIQKPKDVTDLQGYEVVCLLNVADPMQPTPGGTLWEKVKTFAIRGGKVILLPGPSALIKSYDANSVDLLPGSLKTMIGTVDLFNADNDKRYFGVNWATKDDADLKHPLFSEYVKWKRQGNVEIVKNPRKYWRYWDVEVAAGAVVVMNYDDADDRNKRHPAILEKSIGGNGGKVLLFTSRFDPQSDRNDAWNDMWLDQTWAVAFPHQLLVTLVGRSSDANFNYTTGDGVPIAIPRSTTPINKVQLIGPGVTSRDSDLEISDKQSEIRLPSTRTNVAGNFLIKSGDEKEGFSLNIPPSESTFAKVESSLIEPVTGPKSVIPVDQNVKFRDLLETKFNQPVDLFPWLMILLLIFLAAEGVVSNRFYRKV